MTAPPGLEDGNQPLVPPWHPATPSSIQQCFACPVEVYRGLATPVEYGLLSSCGVVLIWTR